MKIGIIGLGNMGEPIAANIVGAGFDVTVFDIRPEPVERLRALGAKAAKSIQEIGQSCDILQIVVVNDSQLQAVVFGAQPGTGLLDAARRGSMIVIHSTVQPATCQRIETAALHKGVRVLDAPVSGGALGARDRTLSLIAGGRQEDLEACRPLFQSFASSIIHVGDVGRAQTAKIVNNLCLLINLQGLREGLRLARSAGIDESKMLEVLSVSSGNSWRVGRWQAQKQVEETYTTGVDGISKVRYKDMMLALSEAQRLGTMLPVTALVSQLIDSARD